MREIKLIHVSDIGLETRNDGRKYFMSNFQCPICGDIVKRIKRDGLRAKFCSHGCYAANRSLRGAYKGGQVFISGYFYTYSPKHPLRTYHGYVATHRLIAERKLGRYLQPNEIVHHKNENKLDNSEENIEVMTASQHSKHHQNFRKCKIAN